MSAQAVRAILPNGVAVLEDGTEVQLVVSRGGALGCRPLAVEDDLAGLDQTPQRNPVLNPPTLKSLGLDQLG